jgi:hypothetical protein
MFGQYITSIDNAWKVVTAFAVDDKSAFLLEDWLAAGYRECIWEYGYEPWQNEQIWREMGSVCPVCFALDGQRFKVEWLLSNMRHSAPKYSLSHVNCKCRLRRIERQKEGLDYSEDVTVAPADVAEEFRMPGEPFDIDLIGPDKAREMGIPEDPVDRLWTYDPQRKEWMPYREGSFRSRWNIRRGKLWQ